MHRRAVLASLAAALAAPVLGGAAPTTPGAGAAPPAAGDAAPGLLPSPDDATPAENPFGRAPAAPSSDPSALPVIQYGEDGLPQPVLTLRRRLLAAARTGDLEQLRPILKDNGDPPDLPGGTSPDPLAQIKLLAGDPGGREILAILEEVLEAGHVHVDAGTSQELYVWPYFARYPLDRLSGPQLVELFRLITAGDFQDMQDTGAYSFYRVGITPDGKWSDFENGT